MRKFSVLIVALMLSAASFGQESQTGPAAKNAKPWNSEKKTLNVVFQAEPAIVTGADARKHKLWNSERASLQIRTRKEVNNPKGLEAKNRKVWEESGRRTVNSKASYALPKTMKKKKIWWH
ncbi:hypothetical protein [Algoriphagus sp. CAU 1675]|uniref:hypothetical protein n=1 Tax=Algoriphagus sp. CAU 1675 TaxID=3032597 RepID=UPI0023D9EF9A|nr:hypothetical protein [Algoriphagus sp. CAU 1675]MDF2157609.1 hypothetical protein [Algoriphagus sp. CAU 1675]